MLCHEILAAIQVGQLLPSGEQLAAQLLHYTARQGALPLSAEDKATPEKNNPAENCPSV